jgi:2'-5' RNA ligase
MTAIGANRTFLNLLKQRFFFQRAFVRLHECLVRPQDEIDNEPENVEEQNQEGGESPDELVPRARPDVHERPDYNAEPYRKSEGNETGNNDRADFLKRRHCCGLSSLRRALQTSKGSVSYLVTTNVSKNDDGAVRTFLAIELTDDVRDILARLGRRLEPHNAVLKVVAPESVHLTLKFLGGVPASRLAAVESVVRECAGRSGRVVLRLSGVGTFSGRDRAPRVVWVGIARDDGFAKLQRLAQDLEDGFAGLGFPRERRSFSPHLTLARVREEHPQSQIHALSETVSRIADSFEEQASFPVRGLTLFRSDLSPKGARYTSLSRMSLGQNNSTEAPA